MAEKRRSGGTAVLPEVKPTQSESDRLLLSQLGVGELLRGAILKMVEARSDDPIGFLADHFCNLASVACAQEQQHLNRALWHLRLAHHSQRSVLFKIISGLPLILDLSGLRLVRGPAAGCGGGCTPRRSSACAARGGSRPPPRPLSSAGCTARPTRPCPTTSSGRACSPVPCSPTTSARRSGSTPRWAARPRAPRPGPSAWPCWEPCRRPWRRRRAPGPSAPPTPTTPTPPRRLT
uniref:RIIa domain-containing protein n=1 Tax=Gadus morhua TaxID=8049 RepID=A0A8C5BMD6_GADMO